MSASNWTECPRCRKIADKAKATEQENVASQYGKMSAERWLKLAKAADKPTILEDTLREDYEQGINDDGRYSVHYRGSCETCGFEFVYRHYEDAKP